MLFRHPVAAAALAAALIPGVASSSVAARSHREPALSVASGPGIDVSRLRAQGAGPTADLVQASLARELQAGPVSANGRLVIVVTGINLNSYAGQEGGGGGGGNGGGGGGGGADFDYLEGEALVLGPGGQVLNSHRQIVSLPSSNGGPYYIPGGEQRRVIGLSQAFVQWLRRSSI